MPYIDIRVSKPVDTGEREKLQAEIAGLMELIPGKNAGNTTICISDNYTVYREYQAIDFAFVDIRMYKESPEESKRSFAKRLFGVFESILDIPPSNVQMNFIELPNWATNGDMF